MTPSLRRSHRHRHPFESSDSSDDNDAASFDPIDRLESFEGSLLWPGGLPPRTMLAGPTPRLLSSSILRSASRRNETITRACSRYAGTFGGSIRISLACMPRLHSYSPSNDSPSPVLPPADVTTTTTATTAAAMAETTPSTTSQASSNGSESGVFTHRLYYSAQHNAFYEDNDIAHGTKLSSAIQRGAWVSYNLIHSTDPGQRVHFVARQSRPADDHHANPVPMHLQHLQHHQNQQRQRHQQQQLGFGGAVFRQGQFSLNRNVPPQPSNDITVDKLAMIGWRLHFAPARRMLDSIKVTARSTVLDADSRVVWLVRPLSAALGLSSTTSATWNHSGDNGEQRRDSATAMATEDEDMSEVDKLLSDMYQTGFIRVHELEPRYVGPAESELTSSFVNEPSRTVDLTATLKDEYGFDLYALLVDSGRFGGYDGLGHHVPRGPTAQLFRSSAMPSFSDSSKLPNDPLVIETRWISDIRIDSPPSTTSTLTSPQFNDKATSDFKLHLPKQSLTIHLHSEVLAKHSEYFQGLTECDMAESKARECICEVPSALPPNITALFENLISPPTELTSYIRLCFEFMYTGSIISPNADTEACLNDNSPPWQGHDGSNPEFIRVRCEGTAGIGYLTLGEWTVALHIATRFGITSLINMCERALTYVIIMPTYSNHPQPLQTHQLLTLNQVRVVAQVYGAHQLLRFVEWLPTMKAYMLHETDLGKKMAAGTGCDGQSTHLNPNWWSIFNPSDFE